ncbi:MAG: glycoside hydrolase family 9 protein [Bacteroidota bacterium]
MKVFLVFPLLLLTAACGQPRPISLVNYSHLDGLMETIQMNGKPVSIVHIYAEYPSYRWTDAGEEGIACVDDAARAAVVFLRGYELVGDSSQLSKAKSLLSFVLEMETEDGQFYNFIRGDHTINREGKTSVKSFGWWAGRAVWAMALGSRIMKNTDPAFAQALHDGVRRSLPNVERVLTTYGRTEDVKGFKTPKWLLYDSGADATSELLLGLIEFYRSTNDTLVADYIRKLADGLMMMQQGDEQTFPYGAHRSWQTLWHSWGNSQTHVLASAGSVLSDSVMIASAELEARGFYTRLLIGGMLKEWDFAEPHRKTEFEQIAYGFRPMTVGLLRLYDATHKELYLKMAGLAASWFFGNNVLGTAMYDTSTGRCYDGITDSTHLNRNSGAESTIEALYTLLEIEQYPEAMQYLNYRRSSTRLTDDEFVGIFRSSTGDELELVIHVKTGTVDVRDHRSGE